MKKLIIGIILFVIAMIPTILLTILVIPFTFMYYVVSLKWKTGLSKFTGQLYKISLAFDQLANVSLSPVLNLIMVNQRMDYHSFGDEDDTLSYVIAMNYRLGTLSGFGFFWSRVLEFVDKNHLEKAIENKIKRDKEAVQRLESRGLI